MIIIAVLFLAALAIVHLWVGPDIEVKLNICPRCGGRAQTREQLAIHNCYNTVTGERELK